MEDYDPKEFMLFALKHFKLKVLSHKDNLIFLDQSYQIEVEGKQLFKLSQGGQVIAPFHDVEELCNFIQMDMQFDEKN